MRDTGKISDAPILDFSVVLCQNHHFPYICSSYYVILLFRIASHTVTLKYFILLHIAYPEHLSKVKILLVSKVFTYVAFILCFIR